MSDKSKYNTQTDKIIAPNKRKLTPTEKLAQVLGDKIAPERHIPLDQRLRNLTDEQKAKLQQIEDYAISNFTGTLDELESALGMLRIGHHMGWKILYLVHSKKTIRKYEEILNIKIRDLFEEKGPSAQRSIGLALAEKASNFWKVVSGEIKIEKRREIE
jgi:hypothetical protein